MTQYNNYILKKKVNNFKPDLIHNTYFDYFLHNKSIKSVLTIYDMIYEKFEKEYNYKNSVIKKKNCIEKIKNIICISNSTKNELIRTYRLNEKNVKVIYLGFNKDKSTENPNKKILDNPYILFVGYRGKYKNFQNLIKAFDKSSFLFSNFNLICFGDQFSADENDLIRSYNNLRNKIYTIQGNPKILNFVYKKAKLLIYPSFAEGFGLVTLEAMNMNCPVACSDIDVLREVNNDAAVYFDPHNPNDIREKLEYCLKNNEFTEKLRKNSKIILNRFSWERCAEDTLNFYKKI